MRRRRDDARQDADALALALRDLGLSGSVTETSLDLSGEVTYERWEALGRCFGRIRKAVDWWIGDWLIFGEGEFGEDASQAIEATISDRYDLVESVTGLAHGTLLNLVWICSNVPPGRRRPELTPALHAEVAKLEPDEQVEWLDRCVKGGWSRSRFREEIKAATAPPANGGGDGGGKVVDLLSPAAALEAAARVVWSTGQPTGDGTVVVPAEAWSQLGAALGETD